LITSLNELLSGMQRNAFSSETGEIFGTNRMNAKYINIAIIAIPTHLSALSKVFDCIFDFFLEDININN